MQVNVAGLRRNIKNLAHNYSDAQVKVREATSNDPWGPSATIMAELAELTNNVVAFSEIMQMIWKRLNDHGKNWRHVYKALILLEYLIKTGNEKVSQQCKENIFAIQTLREFVYHEEGKDQGNHVREKAKQLVNLLKDDERLKNERIKALKAKERFAQYPSGFGSDGYIDGPIARGEMPPGWQEEPVKPTSELEMVRPQTAGEEELQLQLAMAMSREEAEQEEAKRRSDDVRLQLALSQSEQDFKHEPNFRQSKPPKEEPTQSHLLDLLDIQLGATSISSPPLGLAAGGLSNTTDPWITPARAASQMSDPWTGTASPPVDPWLPTAGSRSTPLSAAHMGAIGGGMAGAMAMQSNGTNGSEAWGGMRTQSPSVTSGSSTEGWLQTNGNSHAPNSVAVAAASSVVDPWQVPSKSAASAHNTISTVDAWLSDSNKPSVTATPPKSLLNEDPWAPKTGNPNADPWKNIESSTVKPSPDMDEFDIITNRNKSGGSDLLNINNSLSNVSNNNANLLDDLDPLSTANSTLSASTGATSKRPLKDPQSFLGENSALVNLDNLIKPAVAQNITANAVAYNPFSDTVIPPKPNLFQQQQPAVPSINQLKQQSFQMTINQDPWAPASNAATSQDRNLIEMHTNLNSTNPSNYNKNNDNVYNNAVGIGGTGGSMKYSKSDYDAFRPTAHFNQNIDSFYKTPVDDLRNLTLGNDTFMDSLDLSQRHNNPNCNTHLSYPSLYPHVEIINNNNNNDLYAMVKSPSSSPTPSDASPLSHVFSPSYAGAPNPLQSDVFNASNIATHNNNTLRDNNNSSYSYKNNTYLGSTATNTSATIPNATSISPTSSSSFASTYSNILSASLAATPGVTIMPLHQDMQQQQNVGANLFGYGFYDTTTNDLNNQCKLEPTMEAWTLK